MRRTCLPRLLEVVTPLSESEEEPLEIVIL
jgi:hypothetical protein